MRNKKPKDIFTNQKFKLLISKIEDLLRMLGMDKNWTNVKTIKKRLAEKVADILKDEKKVYMVEFKNETESPLCKPNKRAYAKGINELTESYKNGVDFRHDIESLVSNSESTEKERETSEEQNHFDQDTSFSAHSPPRTEIGEPGPSSLSQRNTTAQSPDLKASEVSTRESSVKHFYSTISSPKDDLNDGLNQNISNNDHSGMETLPLETCTETQVTNNFKYLFATDLKVNGCIRKFPTLFLKLSLMFLIRCAVSAQKLQVIFEILHNHVQNFACGVPSVSYFSRIRYMLPQINNDHLKLLLREIDDEITVFFDESPSLGQVGLLVVGFSTKKRDIIIYLYPKNFVKDKEKEKGSYLADFILELINETIGINPDLKNLFSGVVSDSCNSAKLTRELVCKGLKNINGKKIENISCQAHAVALTETIILKNLKLTSLADKLSSCLGNQRSKGSLHSRWNNFLAENDLLSPDKVFKYRRGARWMTDLYNFGIVASMKNQFSKFLDINNSVSLQNGSAIRSLISADECFDEKMLVLKISSALVKSLWKVFASNQPYKKLKKCVDSMSSSLSKIENFLEINEEVLNTDSDGTKIILNSIFMSFQSSKKVADFDGLNGKLSNRKFLLMLFSILKAVASKYLEYKLTIDEAGLRDQDKELNLAVTNVVSERAFAIVKFYENRFSSLPILQACQISQSSINDASTFISLMTFEKLEKYRSRSNEKVVINHNKGILNNYEIIDVKNKSLDLDKANKECEKKASMSLFLLTNLQFIPLDYSEYESKWKKMKDYLKRMKEKPNFKSPGKVQFLKASISAIAELIVESDQYDSEIFLKVPKTITKRYYDSVASCYKNYREAHNIVT